MGVVTDGAGRSYEASPDRDCLLAGVLLSDDPLADGDIATMALPPL